MEVCFKRRLGISYDLTTLSDSDMIKCIETAAKEKNWKIYLPGNISGQTTGLSENYYKGSNVNQAPGGFGWITFNFILRY